MTDADRALKIVRDILDGKHMGEQMHIEIWKKGNGRQPWHFHFKAKNGKIRTDAEAFKTKAGARRAATTFVNKVVSQTMQVPTIVKFTETENKKTGVIKLTW